MSVSVWQGTDGDPADICARAYTHYNNTSGRATGALAHPALDTYSESKDRLLCHLHILDNKLLNNEKEGTHMRKDIIEDIKEEKIAGRIKAERNE